jgi:hypothetical protein
VSFGAKLNVFKNFQFTVTALSPLMARTSFVCCLRRSLRERTCSNWMLSSSARASAFS